MTTVRLNRAAVPVVLFALLFGLAQFHRIAMGVMVPVLERELALSADALGALSGALFLATALSLIPVGVMTDRWGPRRVIPLMLALGVAGTGLFAAAESAGALIGARFLIGLGYSGSGVGMLVVFSRWFPADRLATMTAWTIALGSVGGLTATAPLAWLVERVGWRPCFLALALLTALAALAVAGLVRDAPPGARPLASPGSLADSLKGLRQILLQREIYPLLAMGAVAFGPGMIVVGLWGGPFLRDAFGFDAIQRGHALLAMALASPLAILAVGPLDRRFNTRKGVVLALAAGSAAAFALLALVGPLSAWLAVALMVAINALQSFYVVLVVHCRATFAEHEIGRANTSLSFVGVLAVAAMLSGSGLVVGLFAPAGAGIDPAAYRAVFALVALVMALLAYRRSTDVPPYRPGSKRPPADDGG